MCSQGPKFGPIPNEIKVTLFPILKINPNLQKYFFFFLEDWEIYIQSPHTQAIYYHCILFLLQFLMAKVWLIANMFFY